MNLRLQCLLVLFGILAPVSLHGQAGFDWPMYGHDGVSTRFSPLKNINTTNIANLNRAWTYHMAPQPSASGGLLSSRIRQRRSEATPLMVDGVLYLPIAYRHTGPHGPYDRSWDDEKHWPCQQPPWGQPVALNLDTGYTWKVPLGTISELDTKVEHNIGSLNMDGSIATAGGLSFISATNDHHFRAFESKTGRILWDVELEAGAYDTAIIYKAKNGKQYVVIVATGGGYYDKTGDDSVAAFALL